MQDMQDLQLQITITLPWHGKISYGVSEIVGISETHTFCLFAFFLSLKSTSENDNPSVNAKQKNDNLLKCKKYKAADGLSHKVG
ncbi:unnamed protein product [Arctia plantaginis]|uniref:Uncharacterized protein n=1 Tax=Arctia plantaginis TaxID=874455 RepID=A0A8S0YV97_ARCPL|nr:unnamed protein product [Arctia plantaginis]